MFSTFAWLFERPRLYLIYRHHSYSPDAKILFLSIYFSSGEKLNILVNISGIPLTGWFKWCGVFQVLFLLFYMLAEIWTSSSDRLLNVCTVWGNTFFLVCSETEENIFCSYGLWLFLIWCTLVDYIEWNTIKAIVLPNLFHYGYDRYDLGRFLTFSLVRTRHPEILRRLLPSFLSLCINVDKIILPIWIYLPYKFVTS